MNKLFISASCTAEGSCKEKTRGKRNREHLRYMCASTTSDRLKLVRAIHPSRCFPQSLLKLQSVLGTAPSWGS